MLEPRSRSMCRLSKYKHADLEVIVGDWTSWQNEGEEFSLETPASVTELPSMQFLCKVKRSDSILEEACWQLHSGLRQI
jgi:hypothetical protein